MPLLTGMTSPAQHHQAIARLAQVAGVANTALHLSMTSSDLLMHFLADQSPQALSEQALFFVLQCLPAASLADSAVRATLLQSLDGLPVSFTDQQPEPAVLAGEVELKDAHGAAVISLGLLAGADLVRQFDLSQALVSLCYDLKQGSEEAARYQWQRFWAKVNVLQFLPLFY